MRSIDPEFFEGSIRSTALRIDPEPVEGSMLLNKS
jgi:hypothetical protein